MNLPRQFGDERLAMSILYESTHWSLILLCAVSSLVVIFLWKSGNQNKKNLPPCLPALPIVGSIPFLRLTGTNDHLRYQELVPKYGNICSFWLGNKFVVLISGYDLIRTALLSQPVVMAGRPFTDMYSVKLNNHKCLGLVLPSYSALGWKTERQVSLAILKEFGFGKRLMESRIMREVVNLVSYLEQSNGKPQDLREALDISVSNVICSVITGKRYAFNDCGELVSVLDAIRKEFEYFSKAMIVDFIPLTAYLPSLQKPLEEVSGSYRFFRDFIVRSIKEHEDAYALGKEDDFIDAFIGRLGKEYSSERLLYIVRDLFIAGTETSATTLQWAVIYMANNPAIQRRVQLEIDQVVGRQRPVGLADKALLPYTEAVVLEVQRLTSLLPLGVPHMTLSDTELSGYHIPAKSMVFINLWSVLRDPVLWPEPEKFNPERFLNDNGDVVHRSELISFSLGRRSCLGEVLARQKVFLFFCGLVQNFNIVIPDGIAKLDEEGTAFLARTPLDFKVKLESRI